MTRPISSILNGTRQELVAMPWPEYLDYPALNGSTLTAGRKSLLHLRDAWDHDHPDTEAMQFGRLVHCLLFEPREVGARYRTWEGRRAGNDYQLFRALAEADGAEVVRADGQYSLEAALEAAQGFLRSARVKELIAAGQAEQTVLAVECGLQCKGRLDWVSTAEHVLTDLKTTRDIEDEAFGRQFFRLGYDLKLGLYQRWLNAVTGDQWPVEVIVLENQRPYDVAVIPVPQAVLDAGVDKAMKIIEQVQGAIVADQWPGVSDGGLVPLAVPYWAMEETLTGYEDGP